MRIITRYLIREIGKHFFVILIAVMGIYLAIDFIERVDDFLGVGLPTRRAILYFIYMLPMVIFQFVPVAVLLAVLITFGLMAKHNELVALRSSGVNLLSLLAPIVGFGLGATFIVMLMAEGVAPLTVPQANQIWEQEVRGRTAKTTRQQDIWLKGEQSIVHIKYFQPDTQTVRGVVVHWFDRQFRLVRRIDAQTGTYQQNEGLWRLQHGVEHMHDGQTHLRVTPFDDLHVALDFAPDELARVAPRTEEMSFAQLYRFIQRLNAEGYDTTHYRVDLHAKIAFPFVCVIMTLLGAGLSARGRMRDGMAISITYGIGIAFVYWIIFSFCLSLGHAGMLPPFIAAWAVNLISICMAGYLLIHAD